MADHVFIFGAGASVSAGVPTMDGFFHKALDLRDSSGDEELNKSVDLVEEAKGELRRVFSNANLDLDNFEDLYGALEMAVLLGRLGQKENNEVAQYKKAILNMISKTVELSCIFEINNNPNNDTIKFKANRNYKSLISHLKKQTLLNNSAFITFNYDILLDLALIEEFTGDAYIVAYDGIRKAVDFSVLDYSFNQENSSRTDLPLVLKLHGSINWAQCSSDSCDYVGPYYQNGTLYPMLTTELEEKTGNIQFSHLIKDNKCKHCGSFLVPAIIPPTYSKGTHQQSLVRE